MTAHFVQPHIAEFLSRLSNTRQTESGWTAKCPSHDDNANSLSVGIGNDNRILVRCFAGCDAQQIVESVGLQLKDLFPPREESTTALRRTPPNRNADKGKPASKPPEPPPEPATVATLAERKRLPADFLRDQFHLRDLPGGNGVAIPYFAPDGSILFERKRTALVAKQGTYQAKGVKLRPYGLWLPRQEDYLVLVEGESDCWTLTHHGIPALGMPGASAAKCVSLDYLEGIARLYLWRESDNAGSKFVDSLHKHLRGIGYAGEIRLLAHPRFKDPSDLHCADPERFADEFRALLEAAPLVEQEKPQAATPEDAGDLPRMPVLVAGDVLHLAVEQSVNALGKHPAIFKRAGKLVKITAEGKLIELDSDTIVEPLTRVAAFGKLNAKGEAVPTQPPAVLLKAIAKRNEFQGVREVIGVTDTPILRPDGSIVDRPGYDALTKVIYRPSTDYPPIPARPTREEAQQAAQRLLDLIGDFPIVTEDCRAVWLCTLLSVVGRSAIDGPVPLTLFEASAAGSGKTLLAELIGLIATGKETPICEYSDDQEELRKSLTAILRNAAPIANLDNAVILGGAALDAVLTARTFDARILGKSERTGDMPVNTVFMATANNPILRGDTHRRVVLCRQVPQTERPEERQGFRIPDLAGYVRENRASLVADCLTIWRHHFSTGEPAPQLPNLGRFEAWTATVRTAVHRATGFDPAASRSLLPSEVRGDASLLARIFAGIARLPGGSSRPGLTGKRILELLERCPAEFEELRDALSEWSKDGTIPNARQIGNRLKQARGRVSGGLQLRSTEDPHTKAMHWYAAQSADSAVSADSVSAPYIHAHKEEEEKSPRIRGVETESAESAESAKDNPVLNGQGRKEYRL